jgi:hypothetical protein
VRGGKGATEKCAWETGLDKDGLTGIVGFEGEKNVATTATPTMMMNKG